VAIAPSSVFGIIVHHHAACFSHFTVGIWKDMVAFFESKEDDKVSNILGALQLMLAVSIFQMLCVAEFPLEDADQTFRSSPSRKGRNAFIAFSYES